jgi:hypothetical protein
MLNLITSTRQPRSIVPNKRKPFVESHQGLCRAVLEYSPITRITAKPSLGAHSVASRVRSQKTHNRAHV